MSFTIPYDELEIKATTGGGPGGQHINKTSTRIELRWNVLSSRSLTEEQRARLQTQLRRRIDGNGNIRVVCGAHRSQQRNKDIAIGRLNQIVTRALKPVKPRKKTRPSRAQREQRLKDKRRRSDTKRQRRRPEGDD
jgi:ribosome-associated protein